MAQLIPIFLKELTNEAVTTRKMLERVPADKFDWKPHAKSMNLRQLATHVAELPGWVTMTINTSELDFAKEAYNPKQLGSAEELLSFFEACNQDALDTLKNTTEEELDKTWVLRTGEQIHVNGSKAEMIRGALNQTTHHRAQLGVYLRLLDIPIPGSYGPSADEMNF